MSAYQKLEKKFYRLGQLGHLGAIVGWDQRTMMPKGGASARANAMAELAVISHEIVTGSDMADLFDAAASENLSDWQRANLREMHQSWRQESCLPAELVEAKSLAEAKSEDAWQEMRGKNAWDDFKPIFAEVVRLTREEADVRLAATDSDDAPISRYEALLALYEPGCSIAEIDQVFGTLKETLPALTQEIIEKQQSEAVTTPEGPFSTSSQEALVREVMLHLGFDFDGGRLDVSHHPFCGGVPEDVRITTRYSETDFVESLYAVIHETGHASYERGLPREWGNQPVGMARSMGFHESQSLLFEMQIGRSRAYVSYLVPLLEKQLGNKGAYTVDNMARLLTRVEPGYIRVNADEVTYPAHVILRYEIEKDLVEGKIEVGAIPELWHQKMIEYLGLETGNNHKDGCMQDVHWPAGAIGYFPTYTLGALTAAQLFAKLKTAISDIDRQIAKGDITAIREWLGKNIWSVASSLSGKDLIKHATGEPLNPDYFLTHLKDRYLDA